MPFPSLLNNYKYRLFWSADSSPLEDSLAKNLRQLERFRETKLPVLAWESTSTSRLPYPEEQDVDVASRGCTAKSRLNR